MRLIGLLLVVGAAMCIALPMTRAVLPFRIALTSPDAASLSVFLLLAGTAAVLSSMMR